VKTDTPSRISLRLALALLLTLFVSACSSVDTNSTTSSTIATTLSTPISTLEKILADQPPGTKKAIAGEPLPANQVLPLSFGLTYNDTAFEKDISQIYTPGSPAYRKYLTPEQITQRYAISDQQLQQIQNWLKQAGYTIETVDALRSSIQVHATVGTIQQSLGIQLKSYNLLGQSFYMQDGTPKMPSTVAQLVQSIIGLDNFAVPQFRPPFALTKQNNATLAGNCANYGAKQTLTRDKLAAAYQLDQLYHQNIQGQSMSIGIAEFSEPYDPADIANYTACVGIPTPTIQNVEIDGSVKPGPGAGEAAMDIELVAGLAPQAQIFVYQAKIGNDYASFAKGLLDLFNRVATDRRVQVLTVSYGASEDAFNTSTMAAINRSLRTLGAEGVSVFISSGDCGAYSLRVHNLATVSFPASAPYAISVGGTHLQVDDQNVRTSETAWGKDNQAAMCQNEWGSGGGVSQNRAFERPSWQVGPGTNTHYDGTSSAVFTTAFPPQPLSAPNGLRQLPDISAAAYPNIAIYYQGSWVAAGGTSASAPIVAAGTALVGQALNLGGKPVLGGVPTFYQVANHPGNFQPYTDVVEGTNLFYPATPNWDYVTGWGSPNFNQLLQLGLAE